MWNFRNSFLEPQHISSFGNLSVDASCGLNSYKEECIPHGGSKMMSENSKNKEKGVAFESNFYTYFPENLKNNIMTSFWRC